MKAVLSILQASGCLFSPIPPTYWLRQEIYSPCFGRRSSGDSLRKCTAETPLYTLGCSPGLRRIQSYTLLYSARLASRTSFYFRWQSEHSFSASLHGSGECMCTR